MNSSLSPLSTHPQGEVKTVENRELDMAGNEPLVVDTPKGRYQVEWDDSLVFLRRKTASIIREDEFAMIQSSLDRIRGKSRFKAEIKKNMIVIHQADESSGLAELLPPWFDAAKVEELKAKHASYQPVMRFVLEQKEKRLFRPERFCFRGSVDDWIVLGLPTSLKNLSAEFLKHRFFRKVSSF